MRSSTSNSAICQLLWICIYDEECSSCLTVLCVIPDSKVYPLQDVVPYGINAVKAFEVSDSLVSNRKVCIIDSGYDINHPDLPNGSTVTGSTGEAGPWDEDGDGHGTHVAGTIAALSNGGGVVGVARNGELQLHIVRVFGDDGVYAWGSDLVYAVSSFCFKHTVDGISIDR